MATGAAEDSLGWCLTQLAKAVAPSSTAVDWSWSESGQAQPQPQAGLSRALIAIRTRHIKGAAGIARYRSRGGLRPLLELLRRPRARKALDLALSILGNCCTEAESRSEVRTLGGIPLLVTLLRSINIGSIQNRAARALGNLAIDPDNSVLIHKAGGVSALLLCLSSSSSAPDSPTPQEAECAQSVVRALRNLADTPAHRGLLVAQGAVAALGARLAAPCPPALRLAALRALAELTRGCSQACARELARAGVLARLGPLAAEPRAPQQELALRVLAHCCAQGCLRPLVGSLGAVARFVEEVRHEPARSAAFLRALCLCCREAVNRPRVRAAGGLDVLLGALAGRPGPALVRLVLLAFVDFVYDEAALEQLQGAGLVPLLVARLVELARGEGPGRGGEEPADPYTPSFDFPPLEAARREGSAEGQGSSSFLSLRSWLLSEGLISSEGEVSPQWSPGGESEWGADCSAGSPPPPSSSQASPPRAPPACSARPPPEAPPYPHPYHPEPWTPESAALVLLSRASQALDPSAVLAQPAALAGLLEYLQLRRDPSPRLGRLLGRLSCHPACLQALLRCGAASLLHLRLVRGLQGAPGRPQPEGTRLRVRELGLTLLSNLRVQCESGFGAGVLTHLMLSGSDPERLACALALPLVTSNRSLLRKLLLDHAGLRLALQPLCCRDDAPDAEDDPLGCGGALGAWLPPPHPPSAPRLRALYCCALADSLSALLGRPEGEGGAPRPPRPPPPAPCPYRRAPPDLLLLLDDGTRVPASRDALTGEGGSPYFHALLLGGFREARATGGVPIRDVTPEMLLPVLHFLHGCRLGDGPACPLLGALGAPAGGEPPLWGLPGGGEPPLLAAMRGASRFLVSGLQAQLEQRCVSLLGQQGASGPGQSGPESLGKLGRSGLGQSGPESLGGSGPGRSGPESLGKLGRQDSESLGGSGPGRSGPESLGEHGGQDSESLGGSGLGRSVPESLGELGGQDSESLGGSGLGRSGPESLGKLGRQDSESLGGSGPGQSGPESLGKLGRQDSESLGGSGPGRSGPESLGKLGRQDSESLGGSGPGRSGPESLGEHGGQNSESLGGSGPGRSGPESLGEHGGQDSESLGGSELGWSGQDSESLGGSGLGRSGPESLGEHGGQDSESLGGSELGWSGQDLESLGGSGLGWSGQDSESLGGSGPGRSGPDSEPDRASLLGALPSLYQFSQQHGYPLLGRHCLALLLAARPPLPLAPAAACLGQISEHAHCGQRLQEDILAMVTRALT